MNIIIAHGFEPNYWIGYVKGLKANGIDFIVISSDVTHERLIKNKIKSLNFRGDQSEDRCLKDKIVNLLRYYNRLIVYLMKNKNATIHMTGMFRNEFVLFEGLFLSLFFWFVSSRYIYTAHNLLPHNKERSLFYKVIYKFVYKLPNIILVHTKLFKKKLIADFRIAENKIKVISIGLNEEIPITEMKDNDARIRLGFKNTDKLLLCFGSIDEYKGVDLLIKAFDKLKMNSLKLVIAGRFKNEEYKKKIYALINAVDCTDKIFLFDRFIPNEEVEVFFKSCDVIVLPYRSIDQSGIVFLSFRFGMPIIATDVGSLCEYIDNDTGIIIKTNDANGLVDSLIYFFDNRNNFNKNKIRHKSKKYKWKNICKTILPIYE